MVFRFLIFVFLFLTIACNKPNKTKENVFSEKYQKPDVTKCAAESAQKIENKFIVRWEDGSVTTERSENSDLFVEKFLEPNLQLVKHVEFDKKVKLVQPSSVSIKDDATLDPMWGQKMIGATAAWESGIKGDGVLVAVIDTVIDNTHPLLKNQFVAGWDFISGTTYPGVSENIHPHATHVAGIIAGQEKVGDMQGVAPKAKILGISFLDNQGGGSLSDGITAMKFAADRGAKIINNSWGGDYCSETMKYVMQQVEQKGVLVIVAAGNGGLDGIGDDLEFAPEYPAAFNISGQITVAAGNVFDLMTSFSNHSWNLVHLSAPGDLIYSSTPHEKYHELSGTSMAAPFVSGAAALLLSVKPDATPYQLKEALLRSVDIKNYRVQTQGRLNVDKAIQEIRKF